MLATDLILYVEAGAVAILSAVILFFLTRKDMASEEEDESPDASAPADSTAGPPVGESATEQAPVQKEPIESVQEVSEDPKRLFFSGLAKSREALAAGLRRVFGGSVDEDSLEELEEALLSADVGVSVAMELVELLRAGASKEQTPEELKSLLATELHRRLGDSSPLASCSPLVILVVGVNGSGKTTTIGKLAHRYRKEGKSVLLAAGDTFRAGAIEQLKVWADRSGSEFISSDPGADPASVVHNALSAAKARGTDVVICDTAGRLQAQTTLMDELRKVVRVAGKVMPGSPHETLLVLDATIGQNALFQAEGFQQAADVTGVALTKLDGTAKGGVVIAVRDKLGIPVKLVGLGEGMEDLRDFDPSAFVDALLNHEPGT
jgi:fused signal recognition particle receptor